MPAAERRIAATSSSSSGRDGADQSPRSTRRSSCSAEAPAREIFVIWLSSRVTIIERVRTKGGESICVEDIIVTVALAARPRGYPEPRAAGRAAAGLPQHLEGELKNVQELLERLGDAPTRLSSPPRRSQSYAWTRPWRARSSARRTRSPCAASRSAARARRSSSSSSRSRRPVPRSAGRPAARAVR